MFYKLSKECLTCRSFKECKGQLAEGSFCMDEKEDGMMRITEQVISRKVEKMNRIAEEITDKKILHVCKRNDAYAVDNFEQNENYACGMSAKECYSFLDGFDHGFHTGGAS